MRVGTLQATTHHASRGHETTSKRRPPNATGGVYVNFVPEGEAPIAEAYGPNYARLVALKRKYDPKNLFRFNQNIAP